MSGTIMTSPPDTATVVQRVLATMAGLSGVITDYNVGSQVRTFAEAAGGVIDQQGVAVAQTALSALTYGTASAYGISGYPAQQATGVVLFATSNTSGAPAAQQSVDIPANTIVATNGGVQYFTSKDTTLAIGATGVSVPVTAVIGGAGGNAPTGAVNQLLSNLGYPLFVSNAAPMNGGAAAEAPSVTLARLAAKQAALGLSSPVAVANACIGVRGSGGSTCRFSNCFEMWVAAGTGSGSGVAGFTVYVDDGSGNASTDLISAVAVALLGNAVTGQSGYRPAGVPFSVCGVSPIQATVTVTGTLLPVASASQVQSAIITQVDDYFSALPFDTAASQPQIAAVAADAALGYFTSLSVALAYSSGGGSVPTIAAGPSNRVILSSLVVTVS